VRRRPPRDPANRAPIDRLPSSLLTKMQSVLRRGLVAAAGALPGTPTDTIEAHLNVLPIDLHLDLIRPRAVIWLMTLPPTHPMHAMVRDAHARPRSSHESALQAFTRRYRIRPDALEEVEVVRRPPYWTPPFDTTRLKREDAVKDDNARATARELRVYSDGSAHDGGVGAAAHLVRPDGTSATLRPSRKAHSSGLARWRRFPTPSLSRRGIPSHIMVCQGIGVDIMACQDIGIDIMLG
jgi:hypothetical protein